MTKRYVIELVGGETRDWAQYAILDTHHILRREICRSRHDDAVKIAYSLNLCDPEIRQVAA